MHVPNEADALHTMSPVELAETSAFTLSVMIPGTSGGTGASLRWLKHKSLRRRDPFMSSILSACELTAGVCICMRPAVMPIHCVGARNGIRSTSAHLCHCELDTVEQPRSLRGPAATEVSFLSAPKNPSTELARDRTSSTTETPVLILVLKMNA